MAETSESMTVVQPKLPTPGGIRELLAVAAPMMVSMGCETAMTFTDRLFLAKLGPELMNAAMGGGIACFTMATFFMGLTGYTTALAAQYLGAGRKSMCSAALTQALLVAVAGYPLIVAASPLMVRAWEAFGVPAEQLAHQKVYFGILINAIIVGLLRHTLSTFFSGVGRTRMVMLAAIAAMVTNIAMNYALIFGKWGFPALGIRGAAYGTILGGLAGVAVLVAGYLRRSNRREFAVGRSLRFNREAMGALLRYGWPAGLEMMLNLIGFTAMITTFQAHAPATSTAVTIMFNWDMVSFVPMMGVGIGVTSLVGRYMGAGDPDTAAKATRSGLKSAWAYSVCILALFALAPGRLVEVFRPDAPDPNFAAAADLAAFMVRLAAVYVMADAMMVVFSSALRGAGDTLWTMIASVTIHWSLAPMLYLILHVFDGSARIAWVTLVAFFLGFCGVFFVRYRTGKWRSMRVVASTAHLVASDHDHELHEPSNL